MHGFRWNELKLKSSPGKRAALKQEAHAELDRLRQAPNRETVAANERQTATAEWKRARKRRT
jgi:hypothetical protein